LSSIFLPEIFQIWKNFHIFSFFSFFSFPSFSSFFSLSSFLPHAAVCMNGTEAGSKWPAALPNVATPHGAPTSNIASRVPCPSPLLPLHYLSGELPMAGNQALKSRNGRPTWKASTMLGFLHGTTKTDAHNIPLAILGLNFIRNQL
jgi:hypothetical protein